MTKEKIPKFFYNLARFATRPMTLQRDELGGVMWTSLCNARLASIPLVLGTRVFYVEKSGMEKGYKKLLKEEFGDIDKWEKHLHKYQAVINKFKEIIKKIDKLKTNDRKEEYYILYKKWLELFKDFVPFTITPYTIEKYIDPECRNLLQKEFGNKSEEYFEILSTPSGLTDFQKMRLEIIELVLNKKESFNKIVKEYCWYNEYSFVEPLLDENYFKTESLKLTLEQAEEEKSKILGNTKNNKEGFSKLIKKIKNPRLKLLADIIHTYTFLRTERIDWLKKMQSKIRCIYDLIAKDLSEKTGKEWNRLEVVYCLNDELLDYINKGVIPSFESVKSRISNSYIYYKDKKSYLISNKKTIKRVVEIVESSEKSTEIKGTIAFKGIARGKVSIVWSKLDLEKVKQGNILVAKTTMPDYTPAMAVASAIITEEGGITSHAAIVARELKKPCIVGTGNCMNLLESGDLIEVNANTGIITILERTK